MSTEISDAFNATYADGLSTAPTNPPKSQIKALGRTIQTSVDAAKSSAAAAQTTANTGVANAATAQTTANNALAIDRRDFITAAKPGRSRGFIDKGEVESSVTKCERPLRVMGRRPLIDLE